MGHSNETPVLILHWPTKLADGVAGNLTVELASDMVVALVQAFCYAIFL